MKVRWRDILATTLVAAAVTAEVLHLAGADVPGLGSGRALTGAVLVLGLGACVAGALTEMAFLPEAYARWMSFLGAGAVMAGLAGLITGAFTMAGALTGAVVAMWIATTIRRVTDPVPQITDKALHDLIDGHHADPKTDRT